MRKHFLVVMSALLCICARTSPADESARAQMKGLDEQVQEVKSDVLSIAAELNQLEEKLLYPSDTHIAVFVSLAHGETLRLDAVQIQIDGRPATHYIYSFKELDALRRGGVQRIYSGNGNRQARQRQGLRSDRALPLHEGDQAEAARRDARRSGFSAARDSPRGLVADAYSVAVAVDGCGAGRHRGAPVRRR